MKGYTADLPCSTNNPLVRSFDGNWLYRSLDDCLCKPILPKFVKHLVVIATIDPF